MNVDVIRHPPVSRYLASELAAVLYPVDAQLARATIEALLRRNRWDLCRYVGRLVGPLEDPAGTLERVAEITADGGRLASTIRGALTELLLVARDERLTDHERREHGRAALQRRGLLRPLGGRL